MDTKSDLDFAGFYMTRTSDIDIEILYALSVRPSVNHILALGRDGCTYIIKLFSVFPPFGRF